MAEDVTRRLQEAKQAVAQRDELRARKTAAYDALRQAEYRLEHVASELQVIQSEIERLENPGVLATLTALFSDNCMKLQKYREVEVTIRQEIDELSRDAEKLSAEMTEIERLLEPLSDADQRYTSALAEKELVSDNSDGDISGEMGQMSGELDTVEQEIRQTEVALDAAKSLLERLGSTNRAASRARSKTTYTHGVIVSAAWNAFQRQTIRPVLSMARDGVGRLRDRLLSLHKEDGNPVDMEIARLAGAMEAYVTSLSQCSVSASGELGSLIGGMTDDVHAVECHLEQKLEQLAERRRGMEERKRALLEG